MQLSSQAKTLFGAAILFILLGVGNIVFGYSKTEYYRSLLDEKEIAASASKSTDSSAEALLESSSATSAGVESLMFPEISKDKKEQHVRRVTSRLHYYQLAVLGGKIFLALAGVCLLSMLISLRMEEKESKG